jgi:hypothetical protein
VLQGTANNRFETWAGRHRAESSRIRVTLAPLWRFRPFMEPPLQSLFRLRIS